MPASVDRDLTSPLVADYAGWLQVVLSHRSTLGRYEHQLARISRVHPDLSSYSEFLRDCLHRRTEFYGSLARQLSGKLTLLRAEPSPALHQQLTNALPAMRLLMAHLIEGLADVTASYSTLAPFLPPAGEQLRNNSNRTCSS